jgi:predicted nucleic acid-binding protein
VIVVDTSVAIKWAVDEPGHAEALALLDLDIPRYAPDLLMPELAYVLRKKTIRGEISAEQARAAVHGVAAAIDRFVPCHSVASAALSLSEALNHSAYDCFFLSVAFGSGVLVTADGVFARKCSENGFAPFVFLLGGPLPTLLAKTVALDLPANTTLSDLRRLSSVVEATITSLYERARPSDPGEFAFVSSSQITPAFESPAYFAMRKQLASLTEDQLGAVLATAWLGRDYHGPEDWPGLVANAKKTVRESADAKVAYVLAQMNELAAGLEKLRQIGLP